MFNKGICINALYTNAIKDSVVLKQKIRKAAESKIFNCVEFYFEGLTKEYKEIGELIKQENLYAIYLAGFKMKNDCIDLGSLNNKDTLKAISQCKEFVDIAYFLNAKKMLILSGPKLDDSKELLESVDRFIESMEQVLNYAKQACSEYLLDVTLEFFNDKGEPYLNIGNIDIVEYVCEKLCAKFDNFCITFDTSHVKQLGGDIKSYYKRLKPYVRHVHLANCVTQNTDSEFYGDKHPLFNIKDGDFTDNDMISFLEFAKETGGSDIIEVCSYEVIAPTNEIADLYYEKTIESASIVLLNE